MATLIVGQPQPIVTFPELLSSKLEYSGAVRRQ